MDLDSRALRGVQVLVTTARWMRESIAVERPVMALTARRFALEGTGGIEIEGFTTYPAPYYEPDSESPTLSLDGQRFFDRGHSKEAFPALVMIDRKSVV